LKIGVQRILSTNVQPHKVSFSKTQRERRPAAAGSIMYWRCVMPALEVHTIAK
jgi:hypothetical protein